MVGSTNGEIHVFKLRDSWMLQKAYEMAMTKWNESYKEAQQATKDTVKARWRDFRIDPRLHVNDNVTVSFTMSSMGTGVLATNVVVDEYQVAQAFRSSTNQQMDFALFSDGSTFDILEEYNKAGNTQNEPETAQALAAYEALNANLQAGETLDLQANGNAPPYDADNMGVGEVLEYVGTIYRAQGGSTKLSTGFFDAPLGIIYTFGEGVTAVNGIKDSNGNAQDVLMNVEVQAGDYKGVKSMPFVDARKAGSGQ
tara:strand:- start:1448 stop:2209 length:762 start_codon:yes stop_codon:yes gene_type:complete